MRVESGNFSVVGLSAVLQSALSRRLAYHAYDITHGRKKLTLSALGPSLDVRI